MIVLQGRFVGRVGGEGRRTDGTLEPNRETGQKKGKG